MILVISWKILKKKHIFDILYSITKFAWGKTYCFLRYFLYLIIPEISVN